MSYGVTAFLIISYVRFWEHFKVTKKIIPLLMIPVIALQWIDRPMYWYGFSEYKQANLVTEDKTILPQSAIWDEVFSQVEYLDFLWGWDVAGTQAFVPKAAQYGVKLNVSQAARQSLQSVAEYAMETTGNLASGIVPENKAYILQNINYILTSLIPQEKLRFFHEDGYYLVIPDDLRISGNYEEIKEETSTISEYDSFLRTLDENHIVCMASYGISEISDVTFVREFLEAAGIELEEELDNNELAMAFEPVNHDLMYSIDPENAVLALENGDQIGNVVLPGQITIAGKSDINLDQSNELGVTICGQHIMLPLYGGIMVYVYNVNTGVVENIAWTTADNTMFNVIENYNFSLPQEE